MSKPWMPLYVADYLQDTAHLSAQEHGAYLLLIMHYWANGCLPSEDKRLARIARLSESEWHEAKPTIAEFFTADWKHKRVDEELAHATEVSNKRRAAADQRHSKSNANAPANAEQKHTQPPPQSQSEISGGGSARPNAFEIATELAAICGHQTPDDWPPGWCGSPHWVQKCLNEGWLPEIMIDGTRAVVRGKRDGPIEHFSYLEKPLARAHARHKAPLPKVEVPQQEVIRGANPSADNRAGGSALAAIRQVQRGLRGEPDRDAPLGLPKG